MPLISAITTHQFFPKKLVDGKTDLAKSAASAGVAISTASFVETQIDERTNLDPDSVPVQVGSGAIGIYVSMKVKPVTDRAIDGTVAAGRFVAAKTVFRKKNKVETAEVPTPDPVPTTQQ